LGFDGVAENSIAVIEYPAVDAVVLGRSQGSEAELARAALQAGKHVFCEKPLVLSQEELEMVMDAAEGAEGTLVVGFNRRFAPLARQLREVLVDGGSAATTSSCVRSCKASSSHWVHDLEQGGGRVLGELCHFVDTLVFLADSPVTEVHASGFGSPDLPAQARDNLAVMLRHGDGALSAIVYVAHSAPRVGKERIEAFGQSGIGILDDYRSLELHGAHRRRIKARGQEKGHQEEVVAFLEGIRAGRPPVALPELANVSMATLAVVDSMRTGATVRLDEIRSDG